MVSAYLALSHATVIVICMQKAQQTLCTVVKRIFFLDFLIELIELSFILNSKRLFLFLRNMETIYNNKLFFLKKIQKN